MFKLLRILFFGKPCPHEWELLQKMEPWSNDKIYLYTCKKCGKIVKKRLHITFWEDA